MKPTSHAHALPRAPGHTGCPGTDLQLRRTLVGFPEAILVLDAGDIVQSANPAAAALTGWTVSELQGIRLDSLISRDELTDIVRARGLRQVEDLQRFHCIVRTKSGERREVSVSVGHLTEAGTPIRLCLLRDIRKQRETERQLLAQVADKQELEAFGRVASWVIHELRNLNNILAVTVRNCRTHLDDPAFRQDAIQTLEDLAGRTKTVIEKLSGPPRQMILRRQGTTLGALVRSALNLLARSGRDGQTATIELRGLDGSLPCVVNVEEMERVIFNVVLNAYEALEPGGRIIISGSGEPAQQEVTLVIEDTGPGFSPAYLERSLFRPFRSTKPHGLGVGLYHAKIIVETHGGTIEVGTREDGPGARITITLPTLDRRAPPVRGSRQEDGHVATEGTHYRR